MKIFLAKAKYLLLALVALVALTMTASAQTDISTAVSTMTTLWSAIEVLAIGVIIFVVGRKLFRKI